MSNTIFILGASSDIGIKLIESFDSSHKIIAHYNKTEDRLSELKKSSDRDIAMVRADLSSETETETMLNNVAEMYGTPDKIVHLPASRFDQIRLKDLRWNNFQEEIDVSLRSLVLTFTKFLPMMAKEKRGKAVCLLSSVVLNTPPKALAHYTTVKYAMLGFIKAAANEYADKNIQINAISPSMIETRFLANINEKSVELNAFNHPLKRNAAVNDIIPCVNMLLSDSSDYINGINIPITGGSII